MVLNSFLGPQYSLKSLLCLSHWGALCLCCEPLPQDSFISPSPLNTHHWLQCCPASALETLV